MALIREQAREVVRVIKAPTPQDGTLHVTGVPPVWPSILVARYVVRAALELGCARIAVHRPAGRDEFDAIEVINGVARTVGYWPRPRLKRPGPLRGYALAGFRGLGAGVEQVRRWVPGLGSWGSARSLSPVSGFAGGGGGA